MYCFHIPISLCGRAGGLRRRDTAFQPQPGVQDEESRLAKRLPKSTSEEETKEPAIAYPNSPSTIFRCYHSPCLQRFPGCLDLLGHALSAVGLKFRSVSEVACCRTVPAECERSLVLPTGALIASRLCGDSQGRSVWGNACACSGVCSAWALPRESVDGPRLIDQSAADSAGKENVF